MNKTKERINKYDNLKGFAIILIVLGHLPALLNPGYDHLFIYIIHLPIFFFVAGYFSKIGPDEPLKSFKRLMIPYLLFCVLWKIYSIVMTGSGGGRLFIEPGGALWFLITLFTMKMILPIVSRFRYPLLFSIIGALLIGCLNIPGNLLGITRTFIYLPIFLIGFNYNDYKAQLTEYNEKIVSFLSRDNVKYASLVIIVILCVIVALNIPTRIVFLQHPYENHIMHKMFLKFIVIILGILFALTLNSIMTNRNCFLTKVGRNSMAVYILHPYLTKFIIKPYINQNFAHGMLSGMIVLAVTFIIVFILSRDFVTDALNSVFDFIFNIFVGVKERV